GIYLATKDDVTQTFFRFGHLGGILKDPDYPALSVMADILGGGFSSRLFRVVRTQKGLAYGVSSGWGAEYNHPGLFRVGGSTKSESTLDTIHAALAEVEKIRTSEVTDQELETAKQSVLNSFVFFFDTPSKTLSRLVTYEYHGYPKDFIFEYQKAVEKVTKADILRVAKEHINPEIFTTVAVGKPQEFGKPLTTLGKVEEIDLTIPEPKKPAAKTDAASIERGKALLQKAQQALGGADALAAIKDYVLTSEVDVQTPQGAMKAKQRTQVVPPSEIRQEQELPFGKIIAYWDGKSGWLSTPKGVVPMPPPLAKQVQGDLFRGISTIMLSDRDSSRTVSAVSDNVVEITSTAGDSVRIGFDASGLPVKQTYQSTGMDGAPTTSEATFSDWKEVAGVKHPHKILIERNGQKYADVTVQEWKINAGLTSEELGKKP
ncbi:MAG: M16 family metallopeptidase, partial [Bryobacteraceae bacterium]